MGLVSGVGKILKRTDVISLEMIRGKNYKTNKQSSKNLSFDTGTSPLLASTQFRKRQSSQLRGSLVW